MKVLYQELASHQRVGGIETATGGLTLTLRAMGVDVIRSSDENCLPGDMRPDCVHFHGIWSPTLARQWFFWTRRDVPCVISPHGMLQPWALAHKHIKKKLAWLIYQRQIVDRVSALHATSANEAANLRRLGVRPQIATIPWGITSPTSVVCGDVKVKLVGQRTAVFVGRVYPVKGLPMLIEAWAKARPIGWKMKIVGPDEAGHREQLEILIRDLGVETAFHFAGALEGEQLQKAYEEADLFVLPSHSENFGMVIGEALGHGVPVITTQGTPWDGLLTHRCGWWTSATVDGIGQALTEATALSDDERQLMGQRGKNWILREYSWKSTALQMRDLYQSVIDRET